MGTNYFRRPRNFQPIGPTLIPSDPPISCEALKKLPSNERNLAYTYLAGREWEKDFFHGARLKTVKGYRGIRPNLSRAISQAIFASTKFMRWSEKHPVGSYAPGLYEAVRCRLSFHEASQLRLYCAIGTWLDAAYGADGFFTFAYREETHTVLFDLKLGSEQVSDRGRVIITKKDYFGRLERVATTIATAINLPSHTKEAFLQTRTH